MLWKSKTSTSPSACKYCWFAQNPISIKKVAPVADMKAREAKKPKPIKKVSDKQKKINAAYTILRKQFLKNHPNCQAQLEGCTYQATDCHHSKGRTGSNMLDETTYIALCHNCHVKVELSPTMAKLLGLSQNRLDN
jgi:hypothetical protein